MDHTKQEATASKRKAEYKTEECVGPRGVADIHRRWWRAIMAVQNREWPFWDQGHTSNDLHLVPGLTHTSTGHPCLPVPFIVLEPHCSCICTLLSKISLERPSASTYECLDEAGAPLLHCCISSLHKFPFFRAFDELDFC